MADDKKPEITEVTRNDPVKRLELIKKNSPPSPAKLWGSTT